jgi:hypothetical protein
MSGRILISNLSIWDKANKDNKSPSKIYWGFYLTSRLLLVPLYMRILFFLLLSCSVYSQKLIRTPYEVRMDSIGLSRLQLGFEPIILKNKSLTWSPFQRLKVNLKTRLNKAILSKLDFDDADEMFDDLDTDDYLSLGMYDIQSKYYLNKWCRITGRVMITGVETQTYFYSIGTILKF